MKIQVIALLTALNGYPCDRVVHTADFPFVVSDYHLCVHT
jgi:hypothetical protein